MKKTLFISMAILLLFSFAQAETNYDKTVNWENTPGQVYYYGTVAVTTADDDTISGEIFYTEAFAIYGLSQSNAHIWVNASGAGTENVNVFVEYSPDGINNFTIGTTNSAVDAVDATIVVDTLNVVNGVADIKYKSMNWARLKFVNGAAVGALTISWGVSIDKPTGVTGNMAKTKETQ